MKDIELVTSPSKEASRINAAIKASQSNLDCSSRKHTELYSDVYSLRNRLQQATNKCERLSEVVSKI